jgi:hypothetical protein
MSNHFVLHGEAVLFHILDPSTELFHMLLAVIPNTGTYGLVFFPNVF